MGIRMTTPPGDITKELANQYNSLEKGILLILHYVGQQFVSDARQSLKIDTAAFPAIRKPTKKDGNKKQPGRGDYMDDTGNLRGSIGYFVLNNGVIVQANLEGTAEGVSAAQAMLSKVPNKTGYQLIGVAGMDYASYLESQGYNVITSQAMMAMVNLEKRLKAFADKKGVDNIKTAQVFMASSL